VVAAERERVAHAVGHGDDVVVTQAVPVQPGGLGEQVARRQAAVCAVGLGQQRADRVVRRDGVQRHGAAEEQRGHRLPHRPALEGLVAVHGGGAVLAHQAAVAIDAHREAEVLGA
jgi:hypothetical protein